MLLPLPTLELGRLGAALGNGSLAPTQPGAVQITGYRTDFRDTYAATQRTTLLMSQLAKASLGSPRVQTAAADALTGVTTEGDVGILDAVWRYIRARVYFVPDEVLLQRWLVGQGLLEENKEGRDLLIAPSVLLAMETPMGDCDDFAMLGAALLMRLGFKDLRFVAVALEEANPQRLSHVYLSVLADGEWVAFDPTPYSLALGYEADWFTRKEEFNV